MTSTSILYQWPISDGPEEFIDIDWPKVHKEVGADCISWIQQQGSDKCDLYLEFIPGARRLVVEFYDNSIQKQYHLMWS